jgi:hypothetical protein
MTGDLGDYRFLLGGKHYVGKLNGASTTYSACYDCLAGGVVSNTLDFKFLGSIASREATISVTTVFASGLFTSVSDIPFDASFNHASSASLARGVYTMTTGAYTLTFDIDVVGQLYGSDTNGCILAGRVGTTHPRVDDYDVSVDVTSCGDKNGTYDGSAALLFDASGQATGLFLSVSNASAAIGWVLSR